LAGQRLSQRLAMSSLTGSFKIQRHGEAHKQGGETKRAFEAMMTMKKIDIAAIEAARRG